MKKRCVSLLKILFLLYWVHSLSTTERERERVYSNNLEQCSKYTNKLYKVSNREWYIIHAVYPTTTTVCVMNTPNKLNSIKIAWWWPKQLNCNLASYFHSFFSFFFFFLKKNSSFLSQSSKEVRKEVNLGFLIKFLLNGI